MRRDLTTSVLLAYASPAVALQAMMVPLLLTLPAFYTAEIGLSLTAAGWVFLAGRLFEAVSDPVIGALSDRTRSRFGRRRIWMVAGIGPALIGTWFLLQPPHGISAGYLLVWVLVFYLGWSMVFIPYQSWGTELSTSFHERTRIAGFREAGSFTGYLLATVLPIVVLQWIGHVEVPGWGQIARVIGVFFVIALPAAVGWCLVVVPRVERRDRGELEWRELYAVPTRNKPFQRLLIAYLLDRIGMGTYLAVMPLWLQHVLGMQADYLTIALTISVASIVFCPVWVLIARRFGKHPSYVAANVVTVATYLGLFIVAPGELTVLILLFATLGFGNAGTQVLPPSMTADAVDYDHLKSGVEQAGAHAAFLMFVFKVGMAAGLGVGYLFLSMTGFDPGITGHTAAQLDGVRLAVSILPAAFVIPAILLMRNFPLTARRHAIIRRRLERNAPASWVDAPLEPDPARVVP